MQKLRTFIAIDFPDEVIKEIARIQNLLKNKPFIGKLTELENLHLTLKFLREIDDKTLAKVKSALLKFTFPEFEATLEEAGTFCYHKKPKIVWIRVGERDTLQLQQEIDKALSLLFPPEQRFMSHLTIARIKYTKTPKDFIDYVKKLSVKKIKFKVKNFKLMSSELKPMGPVYTTLKTYSLK